MSKIETAVRSLQNVTSTYGGYTALCPTHDDGQNSLSIFAGRDGRLHIHCHAGCGWKPVEAMGLTMDDLKGVSVKPIMGSLKKKSREPRKVEPTDEWTGLTLAQYAEAKRLEIGYLGTLGLTNTEYQDKSAVRIPYLNAQGKFALNARVRAAMSGKMKFRWEISGGDTCLYGLWLAPKLWRPCGYAVIVEGESDCHTLWRYNIPAVGLPGATNWNDKRDGAFFAGVELILVIIEPDAGGDAVERWLEERAPSIAPRARLVHLSEDNKDPSTLYLQGSHDLPDATAGGIRWGAIGASMTTLILERFGARRSHIPDEPQFSYVTVPGGPPPMYFRNYLKNWVPIEHDPNTGNQLVEQSVVRVCFRLMSYQVNDSWFAFYLEDPKPLA